MNIIGVGARGDPCTATIFWCIMHYIFNRMVTHLRSAYREPVNYPNNLPFKSWNVGDPKLLLWRVPLSFCLFRYKNRRLRSRRVILSSQHVWCCGFKHCRCWGPVVSFVIKGQDGQTWPLPHSIILPRAANTYVRDTVLWRAALLIQYSMQTVATETFRNSSLLSKLLYSKFGKFLFR
jgi:hypothetical protein